VIVEPVEHIAKLLAVSNPLSEMLTVVSAQRSDQGVAVFAGDGSVFIAMALIEARLLHEDPPEVQFSERWNPSVPPNGEQSTSDRR
jgi:hypothetical protein